MYGASHPLSVISEKPEAEEISTFPLSYIGLSSLNSLNGRNLPNQDSSNPSSPTWKTGYIVPRPSFGMTPKPTVHSEIIRTKKPSFAALHDIHKGEYSVVDLNSKRRRKQSCEVPANSTLLNER